MNERLDKIKTHFRENRRTYIAAGVGLIIGGVSVYAVLHGNSKVINTQKMNALVNYKPIQVQVTKTILERRACMEPIPVRCKETGEVFGSIRRAAKLLNIPANKISAHLKGKLPSANELHFETVDLAS